MLTLDNFFALDVVGFIKLKFALGVVLRALTGLDGDKVIVAEDVIRIGLERMFGVEMVGFIVEDELRPLELFLLKS